MNRFDRIVGPRGNCKIKKKFTFEQKKKKKEFYAGFRVPPPPGQVVVDSKMSS